MHNCRIVMNHLSFPISEFIVEKIGLVNTAFPIRLSFSKFSADLFYIYKHRQCFSST